MSNSPNRRVACLLATLVALGCALPAQAGKNKKKEPKPKPDLYAVVQVDAEIRVIKDAAIKSVKAEVDQKYKAALAEYQTAQKEAKQKKEKFEQPKPKKAKFKVLKGRLKDQAAAEAYVAKLREKDSKKSEGEDKGKGKDEDKKSGKDDKKGKK